MYKAHKSIVHNNLLLKIFSLIFGYCLWHVISQSHVTTQEHCVPLFFYNIPQQTNIVAPDHITVQLRSTKAALKNLAASCAAHIDAQTFHEGNNLIHITSETLFLPKNIELTYVTPAPVMVALEKIQ